MEFKCGDVTIRCVNPEALPLAKKKLAKLIIELAQNKIEREQKITVTNIRRESNGQANNKRSY